MKRSRASRRGGVLAGLLGALTTLAVVAATWFALSTGAAENAKTDDVVNSIGMKLKRIPAGTFRMGSPEKEGDRGSDESPHEVRLTKPFYLGVFEVTQEQYQKVMGVNPSWFTQKAGGKARIKGDTSDFPVDDVTWHQAVEFCRKLSEMPGEKSKNRIYRLPTEAEWEYACRSGTTTVFHCGDSLDSYQANFNGLSPYNGRPSPYLRTTNKAGEHTANRFGLYDMHGNVQEWCADWYAADYYATAPRDDPPGPKEGKERVLRGGCWMHSGKACRSAVRNKLPPSASNYGVGFRVVMEAGS